MVEVAYAVVKPRAVMIHFENASFTDTAVVSTWRFG